MEKDESILRVGEGTSSSQLRAYTRGIGRKMVLILWNAPSLPWYILPRRGRPVKVQAVHEMHPMAYLDGLRGYLAIVVLSFHTGGSLWFWLPNTLKAIPWVQFPLRGGHTAVCLFFWISGYVCTYKIAGLIQTKQFSKLYDTIVSAVFRRYFRLFLPVIPVVLVTAICIRLGIMQAGEQKEKLVGPNPFLFWIKDTGHLLNPFPNVTSWFTGAEGSLLLFQMWSVNTEFRSTMIIFLVCIAMSKISTTRRKLFLWLLIPALVAWEATYAAMAFIGMWCAECRQEDQRKKDLGNPAVNVEVKQTESQPAAVDIDFLEKQSASQKPCHCSTWCHYVTEFESRYLSMFKKVALTSVFLYAFVIVKDPDDMDKKHFFPHNVLNSMIPADWRGNFKQQFLHLALGATMILIPLDRLLFLQRPLLTQFSQFLGELSFGIYTVHIPVKWLVLDSRYDAWARKRYGDFAYMHFWVAFGGWAVMVIVSIWCAELFRRLDMQVIRFSKYLETIAFDA